MEIIQFFLTGQFWFAEFLALIVAMGFGVVGMGVTEGNLRTQIPLTNGKQKFAFIGVFFIASVVLNLVLFSMVRLAGLVGLV